ncbi:beta-glucosidase [Fulvitalea axinellae]|uniref:beta-glucosidase n=1 Tax=Fulvitalea axinellae TaxID=1182444 RepID=A0AAU9CMA1_9BACT|nr:beta-glucosidase [Fulvitalea axinellae]
MTRKFFRLLQLTLALSIGVACSGKKEQPEDYNDTDLAPAKRAEILLSQMTLREKIGQMCMYVSDGVKPPTDTLTSTADDFVDYTLKNNELGQLISEGLVGSFIKVKDANTAGFLQKLAKKSRLGIPLLISTDAIHGHGMTQHSTTIYPTSIGLAASFDIEAAERMARYTAEEMRATGYHWTFSPNIEVVRDARWGRIGETFGEDPLLITEIGKAMVKGYQGDELSGDDKVLACAKHLVAGGVPQGGLNAAPSDVSERSLEEVFYPPFVDNVNQGVFTVMPAHNEINGVPCHAHGQLLNGVLRDRWGFNGFIVSDWMDMEKLENVHHIAKDRKEAYVKSVLAGVDVHMHGMHFLDNIEAAVKEGLIPESRIDDAAKTILEAKFRLGLFENTATDAKNIDKKLRTKEHKALALESAKRSMVLLKNDGETLPLGDKPLKILVTGPHANSQAILGDWAKRQKPENIVTVAEGIAEFAPKGSVIDNYDCGENAVIDAKNIATAKRKAQKADLVIAVVGENSLRDSRHKTSGENIDRASLELPGTQLDLLKAIKTSGKKLVVVYVNGGPIASPWTVENADAILEAWEPGMLGGQAVAETLFGLNNPSGRLPITFPQSAGHTQSFYNHKPSLYSRGKFKFAKREPMFPFGFGLSYTNFEYSDLKIPAKIKAGDTLRFSFTLKNAGKMDGDEMVLAFMTDKYASVTRPVKELAAFKRVSLKAGESKKVEMSIVPERFEMLDLDMKKVIEPGEFDIVLGLDNIKRMTTVE